MDFSSLVKIALAAVPIILAITVHEAAHGYVARMFGDSTAWMLGRVTLNPLKHIDPVGTVLVPLAPLLLAGEGDPVLDADKLAKSPVTAEIVGHERGKKLRVFKFKPKRGYRRRTGHRQELTRLRITKIEKSD